MSRRTTISIAITLGLLLIGLLAMALPAFGDSLSQLDPTAQQQTVDAAVNQLFTQTAAAGQGVALTQTVAAAFAQASTATAVAQVTAQAQTAQPLTATAAFEQTVQAQFAQSLTATAVSLTATAEAPDLLFPELDAESILSFFVQENSSEALLEVGHLGQDLSEEWVIVRASNPQNRPADQTLAQETANRLASLAVLSRLPGQDPVNFGLTEPAYTLTFTLEDGTGYEIVVGEPETESSPFPASLTVRTQPLDEATPTATPENSTTILTIEQAMLQPLLDLIETPPYLPLPPTPEPIIAEIQVAEQVFENGRMMWVEPTDQIWVMLLTQERGGTWLVFEDTFVEGEPESDPTITAPEGLIQPTRGFGKLWRENLELREALGWAITPEFGYLSPYEYHTGGAFDENDQFIPGPGFHVLLSLNSEAFSFDETDGTWRLGVERE